LRLLIFKAKINTTHVALTV